MTGSSPTKAVRKALEQLKHAIHLSDTGQHTAVVAFLRECPEEALEQSPTLALLYGTAQARLGHHDEGRGWVDVAMTQAIQRGDEAVEPRALNARGAIALAGGDLDEAREFFERGLESARRLGDHATIGRCSNNLGIIDNMRGRFGAAIGWYTMALAAFQQVDFQRGVAEVEHNLSITYRDQGECPRALEQASRALHSAEAAGDRALFAQTLALRAETRLQGDDVALAGRDADEAVRIHRELHDAPGETADLRVLAGVQAGQGKTEDAERLLRECMARARDQGRPLIEAVAGRDLARLLLTLGRPDEALDVARAARVIAIEIGTDAEVERLDEVIGTAG